jgi:hypothetical protein
MSPKVESPLPTANPFGVDFKLCSNCTECRRRCDRPCLADMAWMCDALMLEMVHQLGISSLSEAMLAGRL